MRKKEQARPLYVSMAVMQRLDVAILSYLDGMDEVHFAGRTFQAQRAKLTVASLPRALE